MLNKNFYPTPRELVWSMIHKLKKRNYKRILEPSAGKGNIVENILKKSNFIDCIEIDTELQNYLIGKGYNVVANDFLKYNTFKNYDAIIMNPPFDNGVKHLLKAIELGEQSSYCEIVCLLNAETIKNNFSNDRKLLKQKLQKYDATIEYKQNTFINAERKAGVEIALVYIKLERKLNSKLFEDIKLKYVEEKEEINKNEIDLKHTNIQNLIIDYNIECDLLNKINQYTTLYNEFILCNKDNMYNTVDIKPLDDLLNNVRIKYWNKVLYTDEIKKYLTTNVKSSFNDLINKQSNIEFEYNNIMQVKSLLMNTFINNLKSSIIDVFNKITAYNYTEYSKNIHYYNGWKTNKAYKINKKIILPISFNRWYENGVDYNQSWYNKELILEIEKIMNYYDGLNEYKSVENSEVIDSKLSGDYIEIKAFKKGTTHIWFKRLDLLDKINLFVGKKNNWLPDEDNYKYKDIQKEVCEHYKDEYVDLTFKNIKLIN